MREALVTSAIRSAQFAEALGLPGDRIILACKVSNVQDLIAVYTELARRCDYPLHLGLTEAGMGSKGIVASTAALAVLLQQGIGDTIRISLTPEPNGDRTREVIVAQEILQTMGLRSFSPLVSACPGCGRTTSEFFQELADKIQSYLRAQMPAWRKLYHGVENMTVAVMGCVVNGPGESKMANIGISLPGTGEVPVAPVYVDGQKTVTLKGERIAEEFEQIVFDYVRATYGGEPAAAHLRPEKKDRIRRSAHGVARDRAPTRIHLEMRYHALIPAAGNGSRFRGDSPKQYWMLDGKPVLVHSLERLAAAFPLQQIHVAVAPGDRWYDEVDRRAGPG